MTIFSVPALSGTDLQTYFRVLRVVDGDTCVLDQIGKVRLIGVDTPETVDPRKPVQYYGKEASAFLRRLLDGKKVRIEYDQQRKDKYNRALVYLYLPDGTFVNSVLIEKGYAHAYTRFPFKYLDQFRAKERKARMDQAGLWAGTLRTIPTESVKKAVAVSCAVHKTCSDFANCDDAKKYFKDCNATPSRSLYPCCILRRPTRRSLFRSRRE